MRNTLTLILILFVTSVTSAQVVNSLSKDKTGFYTHALDTCLTLIRKEKQIDKIYVRNAPCVFNYLPDTLQGIPLLILENDKKNSRTKFHDNEALVTIKCMSIIRDEVSFGILISSNKGMLGAGMYVFYYYYRPETQDYYLKKIKSGMML
jgi:hypothetical protein